MNELNKIKVPKATDGLHKFDLSCDHVTTMSFMRMQPVYYCHMVKGQSIDCSVLANVRPMPMAVPTYGRMRCNMHSFFVPYSLVFKNWNEFMSDNYASNMTASGIPISAPQLPATAINTFFTSSDCSIAGTSSSYDFSIGSTYYKFTAYGRFCYKIFYSLGYDILGPTGSNTTIAFNSLALLAYAKIYIDYYANNNYANTGDILTIKQALEFNTPNSWKILNQTELKAIFDLISYVTYDSNGYFENCFDNPVAPNAGQFTPGSFASSFYQDITLPAPSSVVVKINPTNGTPYMEQGSNAYVNVGSEYIHEMLSRITSYERRHALAGGATIDRLLAQYGKDGVSERIRLQKSTYVGTYSMDINVSDIYATANGQASGEDSVVGDYAGRGFGAGRKSWQFKTDEEGIFLVIASILPSAGYYQGYDRQNRHLTKSDFYVPEWDGTTATIEKGEVYVARDTSTYVSDANDYMGTFGYVGRYGEYARPINRVSGDIALPRIIQGGDSWHLMRDLSIAWSNISSQNHGLLFTRGFDADKFNRVFTYTKNDYEPFIAMFHFDVGSYSPKKPLFDMFEFPELKQQEDGTNITNGAKVN